QRSVSTSISMLRQNENYASRFMSTRSLLPMTRNVSLAYRQFNTQADRELVEFLDNEIQLEKKMMKPKVSPIPGFTIETNGAEIKFQKEFNDELISVKVNVNH